VELISLKEAAKLLGIDRQTVQRHIPFIKIGRRCLIRLADIDHLLKGNARAYCN
jgi:excisionase family DNA binding protein